VAFARTIGRPNFNEIIPNITVTDPAATEVNRTITVVNTGLKPWSADNYDLSLEYYFEKSGRDRDQRLSEEHQGLLRLDPHERDARDCSRTFGLNDDYLDYDIITKENVGDAMVSGIDFDYQQPLTFLPNWARGTMVFFNMTKTHLEGNSTANFSGFTRETTNWGISVSRPRFTVKLTWNHRGRQRAGALTGAGVPPGSYVYNPEYLTLERECRVSLHAPPGAFTVIRNIANKPLIEERYGSVTPTYARVSNYQNLGSQISVGLKGEW
jgi:iron complex outermembrane receptor protein